jgi:hypothetical protein
MKHALILISALLLTPIAALHAAPSPDSHIVIASEAGAKLDSDVTKGGGTDDTALIQSILDRAPKLGSLKLVADGAILVKGLKVHSNTTIECVTSDCGFFLADHADQPIIRNADPSATERKNRNITFLGGNYNGNSAKQTHITLTQRPQQPLSLGRQWSRLAGSLREPRTQAADQSTPSLEHQRQPDQERPLARHR